MSEHTAEEVLAALEAGEKHREEAKGVRRVIERVPWRYRLAQWDCLSGPNEGSNAEVVQAIELWLHPDGSQQRGRVWRGSDEPPQPGARTTKYMLHAHGVDVVEGS